MTRDSLVPIAIGTLLVSSCLLLFASSDINTEEVTTIRLWDACDPDTFNQAVGPGTCMASPSHGTETFQLFIEEVTLDRIAGAWRFGSRHYTMPSGRPTTLNNRGGETHTFTTVTKFGGGFVPILNQLSGNPIPAPECLQPPSDTNIFVEAGKNIAGPTAGSSTLPAGISRHQCCIHPWMRTTITVK